MLYYYIVCVILLHCLCYIITLSLWFLKLPPSYSSSLITEPCVVYSYYSAEVNKCDLDKVIPPATDRNDNILPPTPVLQYVSIPHTNYLLTHCVFVCFSYALCVYLCLTLCTLLCVCLCVFICVCFCLRVCSWLRLLSLYISLLHISHLTWLFVFSLYSRLHVTCVYKLSYIRITVCFLYNIHVGPYITTVSDRWITRNNSTQYLMF